MSDEVCYSPFIEAIANVFKPEVLTTLPMQVSLVEKYDKILQSSLGMRTASRFGHILNFFTGLLLASWTIINHFSKIMIAKLPSLLSFDLFLPTSKNFERIISNAKNRSSLDFTELKEMGGDS